MQTLDSPLTQTPDISQGLQGLHLYGPGPPSPYANPQQLAMIQEHSVLNQIDATVYVMPDYPQLYEYVIFL